VEKRGKEGDRTGEKIRTCCRQDSLEGMNTVAQRGRGIRNRVEAPREGGKSMGDKSNI